MWKRHPKNCKKLFSENGCKHADKCAYTHHVTKYVERQNELKEKVGILEKKIADMTNKYIKETSKLEKLEIVVKALTRKVLCLENEIKEMKTEEEGRREEILEYIEATHKLEKDDGKQIEKEKEPETQKEVSKAKASIKIKEHENKVQEQKKVSKAKHIKVSVFKFGAEENKNVVEKMDDQDTNIISSDFKCDQCSYKAQKLKTLKKHINTTHTEQKCKVCKKDFKTWMELVSHVANEHGEEEEWIVKAQSTPKSDGQAILSSFVFCESMLDKFL